MYSAHFFVSHPYFQPGINAGYSAFDVDSYIHSQSKDRCVSVVYVQLCVKERILVSIIAQLVNKMNIPTCQTSFL